MSHQPHRVDERHIQNLFTQVQSIRHRVTNKKLDQLDMKINLLTTNAVKSTTSIYISAYNYSKTRLSVAPEHCNDSMSFLSYGYISYIYYKWWSRESSVIPCLFCHTVIYHIYITNDDLENQVWFHVFSVIYIYIFHVTYIYCIWHITNDDVENVCDSISFLSYGYIYYIWHIYIYEWTYTSIYILQMMM